MAHPVCLDAVIHSCLHYNEGGNKSHKNFVVIIDVGKIPT